MKKRTGILIVGQGIAGTCLSYFLNQKGVDHMVVDDRSVIAASRVAAGIINPITGRRFVKTWMADKILPFAVNTYKNLGDKLKETLIKPVDILRIFSNVKEENNWFARVGEPGYEPYMKDVCDLDGYEGVLQEAIGAGEVNGFQLSIAKCCQLYREFLEFERKLVEEEFDFDHLNIGIQQIEYKNIICDQIVFCEGFKVIYNPYFNFLPFDPASGDVLLVKIPELSTKKLLKRKIFIVPMDDDFYWIGSNYNWDMEDLEIKESNKEGLIQELKKTIKCNFEVVDHILGVRPAVKDRRPLIGTHPKYANIHLFNGLGTKGGSLAPFWAHHFVKYLIDGEPLDKQVDLLRYHP